MKLEALKELAAKVEAGSSLGEVAGYCEVLPHDLRDHATRSYNGSLDAAKALHDAVLPGWGWQVGHKSCCQLAGLIGDKYELIYVELIGDDNSARAWLLAILRALIAQEEGK